MGNSLFEQLKNSGLVDEKKAKKIGKQKHQALKESVKKKNAKPIVNESTLITQQAQAAKVAKDRELDRQRKEAAQSKAIIAQIKQLIQSNRINTGDGDIAYNFNDAGKVERIYVTQPIQLQLARGQLAIVKFKDTYELVPTVVAEKVRQRDESYVIFCDSEKRREEKDQDDPYADYEVPDDLMW